MQIRSQGRSRSSRHCLCCHNCSPQQRCYSLCLSWCFSHIGDLLILQRWEMSLWCLLPPVKLLSWNCSAQVGCVSQVHLLDFGTKFNPECDKLCWGRFYGLWISTAMNAEIPEISKRDFALRQPCFRLLLLPRFCVHLRCDHLCTFWDVSHMAALSHVPAMLVAPGTPSMQPRSWQYGSLLLPYRWRLLLFREGIKVLAQPYKCDTAISPIFICSMSAANQLSSSMLLL